MTPGGLAESHEEGKASPARDGEVSDAVVCVRREEGEYL